MTVGEILKVLSLYNKDNEVTINNQPITQLEVQCKGYIRIIEAKSKKS
jgi:hypothetical protein